MADETVVDQATEAKKWVRNYQPTDADGSPIGAPQVFEADTEEELIDKLVNAHTHAVRAINKFTRQDKRDRALNSDTDNVPARPRELTADEIFELSNQLIDPEQRTAAINKIATASMGESPDVVRQRIERLETERTRAEAESFIASCPDYVVSKANSEAMMQYVEKHHMAQTRENFEIAFEALTEGQMLEVRASKAVDEEDPKVPGGRITTPEPTVRPRATVTTGLRANQATAQASAAKPKWTKKQILDMPPAEYAERYRDKEFRRIVDSL